MTYRDCRSVILAKGLVNTNHHHERHITHRLTTTTTCLCVGLPCWVTYQLVGRVWYLCRACYSIEYELQHTYETDQATRHKCQPFITHVATALTGQHVWVQINQINQRRLYMQLPLYANPPPQPKCKSGRSKCQRNLPLMVHVAAAAVYTCTNMMGVFLAIQ